MRHLLQLGFSWLAIVAFFATLALWALRLWHLQHEKAAESPRFSVRHYLILRPAFPKEALTEAGQRVQHWLWFSVAVGFASAALVLLLM
jgi:hypothetical protein